GAAEVAAVCRAVPAQEVDDRPVAVGSLRVELVAVSRVTDEGAGRALVAVVEGVQVLVVQVEDGLGQGLLVGGAGLAVGHRLLVGLTNRLVPLEPGAACTGGAAAAASAASLGKDAAPRPTRSLRK